MSVVSCWMNPSGKGPINFFISYSSSSHFTAELSAFYHLKMHSFLILLAWSTIWCWLVVLTDAGKEEKSPPQTSRNPPLEMSVELSVVLNLALTGLLQHGSCLWCWTRFELVFVLHVELSVVLKFKQGLPSYMDHSQYWALIGCRVFKMTGCPWCWIKRRWANAELRAGNKMYFCHTDF